MVTSPKLRNELGLPVDDQAPMSRTTTGHLILVPGTRITLATGLQENSLDDLDPATARLVRQRLSGLPDVRTGREVTRLTERLALGTEDPGTERGHFQWWPDGVRVRRALAEWLRCFHEDELEADPISTATLRGWGADSALRDLAGVYEERLYGTRLDSERPGVLTYGGDPGYLSMLSALTESPRVLPWRVYEQVAAHRRCQSGELGGLQRTRSFEFFDFHSLTKRQLGLEEYLYVLGRQVDFVHRHGHGAAIEVHASVDDTAGIDALAAWVELTGHPVVLSLDLLASKYYRLLHNLYDDHGLHTMHGQLDEWNPQRWLGERGHAMSLVHAASGSLERWILVHLLDAQARPSPALPDWLAPVQLTMLPLRPEHIAGTLRLADRLARVGVRVRVDDRDLTVRRRIRDSVDRWVPRTVVVGDRELAGGALRLRASDGRLEDYDPARLATLLTNRSGRFAWYGGKRLRRASEDSSLG